jgi:hypothetical protein
MTWTEEIIKRGKIVWTHFPLVIYEIPGELGAPATKEKQYAVVHWQYRTGPDSAEVLATFKTKPDALDMVRGNPARKQNYPQSSKWHAIADSNGVKSVAFTGSQSQAEAAASKLVRRGYGAALMPAPSDAPGGWVKHWQKEANNPARLGSGEQKPMPSYVIKATPKQRDKIQQEGFTVEILDRSKDEARVYTYTEHVDELLSLLRRMGVKYTRENPARLGSGERFATLESKLAERGDIADPKALAAAIGRRKYGAEGMAKMAEAGKARHQNYPESKYWMTLAGSDDAFAGNFQQAEKAGKGLEIYGYPVSLRPLGDVYKGKKGWQYEKFRRHFNDSKHMRRRNNPEDAARELSERFHGMPSDTTTVIETLVHVHEHKTELGDLTEMKLITLNGAARDMTIKFKGDLPKLGSNEEPENGTQLYIEGGDQELDLDALGFSDPAWHKEKMNLGVLYEITYDTRKAMDGGKIVSYFHGLGEEDLKKSRSKPQLGVQPTLIYHPPIEAEGQKFPARLEIAGGRYNLLEAERGIVN